MKASDARKLTQNACSTEINQYLNRTYESIANSAKKGYDNVSVESPNEIIVNRVMEKLKEDGYSVKRSNGSDPRDGDSWDSLNICWALAV
jgi:hypothetical protein